MAITRVASTLVTVLALLCLSPLARAEDFYKGKTISVVVGATPGGAFDINARVVARYLPKYVPGNPSVVVQNMPGAGSMTAIRYIESSGPKDGTVIGNFLPGLITQSIVTPEKVPINFKNISWVGIVSGDTSRICYGYGPNGVRSIDELLQRTQDKPFIMGTTGKGASNYINGLSLQEAFGIPVRVILGFPGSSEIRLAVERGELEGDCGGISSLPPDWLKTGRIHPFVRFAEQLGLGVPSEAAYIGSLVKSAEQREFLDFLYGADKLGRPYIMSNQVPADRLKILRTAFNAMMKDADFVSDLEKLQETVIPMTGEEAEKLYGRMSLASPKLIERAKKLY